MIYEYDIFEQAMKISSVSDELRNWYRFEGGRSQLFKKKQKEIKEALSLVETRAICDVWKNNFDKIDPKTRIILEQCCYLTLCIEWGEDSVILFDDKKRIVTCKSEDKEVVL